MYFATKPSNQESTCALASQNTKQYSRGCIIFRNSVACLKVLQPPLQFPSINCPRIPLPSLHLRLQPLLPSIHNRVFRHIFHIFIFGLAVILQLNQVFISSALCKFNRRSRYTYLMRFLHLAELAPLCTLLGILEAKGFPKLHGAAF